LKKNLASDEIIPSDNYTKNTTNDTIFNDTTGNSTNGTTNSSSNYMDDWEIVDDSSDDDYEDIIKDDDEEDIDDIWNHFDGKNKIRPPHGKPPHERRRWANKWKKDHRREREDSDWFRPAHPPKRDH
jgi:hypothetical protein